MWTAYVRIGWILKVPVSWPGDHLLKCLEAQFREIWGCLALWWRTCAGLFVPPPLSDVKKAGTIGNHACSAACLPIALALIFTFFSLSSLSWCLFALFCLRNSLLGSASLVKSPCKGWNDAPEGLVQSAMVNVTGRPNASPGFQSIVVDASLLKSRSSHGRCIPALINSERSGPFFPKSSKKRQKKRSLYTVWWIWK